MAKYICYLIDWPLGTDDVEVAPVFHLVHCSLPDLSQAFPAPEFVRNSDFLTFFTFIYLLLHFYFYYF